jgi:hypothetical protein
MNSIEDQINMILCIWNPINVPENVVLDEYKSYVDVIIDKANSLENTINIIESILKNKIGLDYNPENDNEKKEITNISNQIFYLLETRLASCAFCGSSLIMESRNTAELNIEYGSSRESQNTFVHIICLKEKVHKGFHVLENED